MRSEYPCMTGRLGNAEKLMRLQAESPARMREAIFERSARVRFARGAIHGLKKEVAECEVGVALRRRAVLGIDELELIPRPDHQVGLRLGTHAHPVEAGRRVHGAVGLDRDLESDGVQRFDQGAVELE